MFESKALEDGFDRVEVRQIFRVILHLGVLYDTRFIDDEGRAFGNAAHDQIGFGQELLVGDTVGFGNSVFIVAQQGQGNAFFFGPCGLGKRIVAADADHFRVERFVFGDAVRDVAKLRGADAGKSHGHEQQQNVRGANVLGQGEQLGTFGGFSNKGEIGRFISYSD